MNDLTNPTPKRSFQEIMLVLEPISFWVVAGVGASETSISNFSSVAIAGADNSADRTVDQSR